MSHAPSADVPTMAEYEAALRGVVEKLGEATVALLRASLEVRGAERDGEHSSAPEARERRKQLGLRLVAAWCALDTAGHELFGTSLWSASALGHGSTEDRALVLGDRLSGVAFRVLNGICVGAVDPRTLPGPGRDA